MAFVELTDDFSLLFQLCMLPHLLLNHMIHIVTELH